MGETQVIRLRYWASARAAAGTAEDAVEVDGPQRLLDLAAGAAQRHPGLGRVLEVCSVLVGEDPVGTRDHADVVVAPGSTVEFLPPFAGG